VRATTAVSAAGLFDRPRFIPEAGSLDAWRGASLGLTGGRGVLGGLLLERLGQHGIRAEAYAGDVNDAAALAAWFAGREFSHFFHFAALVPVAEVESDPLRAFETNVIGTFNVCRQLALTQPDCWLFQCSSSHVYQPTGNPDPISEEGATVPATFYGETKLAAERVVAVLNAKLQRPYCIGRVFSFTHARQAAPYLVPNLRERIAALRDGATLEIQNPASVRDIQDAGHVIDVILALAQRRATGILNIGTGVGLTVREIALRVAQSLGKRITVTGVDRGAPSALIADTTRLRGLLAR
jgi:nucleoside-diphosphate-sugar epimerase